MPLGEVGLDHAMAEGEGYTSVGEWRASHEDYWHGAEMRAYLGDPKFAADGLPKVFLESFRVIDRHSRGSPRSQYAARRMGRRPRGGRVDG